MTNPTTEPSTPLSARDRAALSSVLGRMPYLPLVPGYTTQPRTVDQLVTVLAGLVDVLGRQVVQATATREELSQLRQDVAAARRLLGLPIPGGREPYRAPKPCPAGHAHDPHPWEATVQGRPGLVERWACPGVLPENELR